MEEFKVGNIVSLKNDKYHYRKGTLAVVKGIEEDLLTIEWVSEMLTGKTHKVPARFFKNLEHAGQPVKSETTYMKPKKVEYKGYVITQEFNCQVWIFKDGVALCNYSCTQELSDEELRKKADDYERRMKIQ